MSYTIRTAVLIAGLAVCLLASPVHAGETQDTGDVNITIQKQIKFHYTGGNKFSASLTNKDFQQLSERVWNNTGQLRYTINVPWKLSVRRTKWVGPKGWDTAQDAKLKLSVKTDVGYGSNGWQLVPVDPAADWFGSPDDFGKDKSSQMSIKVNWAELQGNKRIGGVYTTDLSFTLYEDNGS
jgi:hypothetical protein